MIRYKNSLLSLTGISPLDLLKEYEGDVSYSKPCETPCQSPSRLAFRISLLKGLLRYQ